jgi:hypothetical protein
VQFLLTLRVAGKCAKHSRSFKVFNSLSFASFVINFVTCVECRQALGARSHILFCARTLTRARYPLRGPQGQGHPRQHLRRHYEVRRHRTGCYQRRQAAQPFASCHRQASGFFPPFFSLLDTRRLFFVLFQVEVEVHLIAFLFPTGHQRGSSQQASCGYAMGSYCAFAPAIFFECHYPCVKEMRGKSLRPPATGMLTPGCRQRSEAFAREGP